MASNYDYKVLSNSQIKLLDMYTPWAYKVRLSELLDEALSGERLGIFDYITVIYDLIVNQNFYLGGNAYLDGWLFVGTGYGYGGYGAQISPDGNMTVAGYIDATAGGIRIREEVIPSSTSLGIIGDTCYGQDGGIWYQYQCVDTNLWGRVPLNIAF